MSDYSFADVSRREKCRYYIAEVLRLLPCYQIRFALRGVNIQSWMWPFVANAIEWGAWCNVEFGNGDGFDFDTMTFHFDRFYPSRPTVVHEATHCLIWATHKGKKIKTETHEAAAYLAEKLFTLNSKDHYDLDLSGQPHLERSRLSELAQFVKKGTKDGKPNVRCDDVPALLNEVITAVRTDARAQDPDEVRVQGGVGEVVGLDKDGNPIRDKDGNPIRQLWKGA
jgi:hypothetical protein